MVNIPRWQVVVVLLVILGGMVAAIPNLLGPETRERLPGWLQQRIVLGLDLRGGSYLRFQADIDSVVGERLEQLSQDLGKEMRALGIGHETPRVEGTLLSFQLTDPGQAADLRAALRERADRFRLQVSEAGAASIAFSDAGLRDLTGQVMEQAARIARDRLDQTGMRERTVQRQGSERLLVQVPGVGDAQEIIDVLGPTAKLSFRFVMDGVVPGRDRIPLRAEILPSDETDARGNPISYAVHKRVMVGGENLVDARASFQDNQPVVSFQFDQEGARLFAEATRRNVGKAFAIVLDGKVISAPVIREPILAGSGVISGQFTIEQTQTLAVLLRAGALPANLDVLEVRSVGPTRGSDSVQAGAIACGLGLLFVIAFMAFGYGRFGVIANLALVANLILIAAALTLLQATLTLPGIAGIVLTIGIAVDANVLIFERIREELQRGRSVLAAVDVGYRRALTTITDANITTAIAALLLFSFGSGPVKGFAVTLAIGLVTSLFTAIAVTRMMVVAWVTRAKPDASAFVAPDGRPMRLSENG